MTKKDMLTSFRNTFCELHALLLLISHCLRFSHMGIPRPCSLRKAVFFTSRHLPSKKAKVLQLRRGNQQGTISSLCLETDPEEDMTLKSNKHLDESINNDTDFPFVFIYHKMMNLEMRKRRLTLELCIHKSQGLEES